MKEQNGFRFASARPNLQNVYFPWNKAFEKTPLGLRSSLKRSVLGRDHWC